MSEKSGMCDKGREILNYENSLDITNAAQNDFFNSCRVACKNRLHEILKKA